MFVQPRNKIVLAANELDFLLNINAHMRAPTLR